MNYFDFDGDTPMTIEPVARIVHSYVPLPSCLCCGASIVEHWMMRPSNLCDGCERAAA